MVLDTISVPFSQNLQNSRLSSKFRYFQSKYHSSFQNTYQKWYLIPFRCHFHKTYNIQYIYRYFQSKYPFFLVKILGCQKMVPNIISVPFSQNLGNSRLSIKFRYFQSKYHSSFQNTYQKWYLILFQCHFHKTYKIQYICRYFQSIFLVKIFGCQKMVT